MKNTGMKAGGKKDVPTLPASSRMQMPSGGGKSTPLIKGMIKGSTKTKKK
jgi:hypothetical protein